MRFVVVPQEARTDRVVFWVGAFDYGKQAPQEVGLRLDPISTLLPLAADNWKVINPPGLPEAERVHYFQVVQSPLLETNRLYRAQLARNSEILATAAFRTLPEALPRLGEDPFTVLLGSCFCLEKDRQGDAGFSFDRLPWEDRPHMKILCGDQVYLDQPTWKNFPMDSAWLAGFFLRKYIDAWSQSDPSGTRGYGRILKEGASYFASDDHEFWNNYPNWTTLVQNSWTKAGRDQWAAPSRYLFNVFQNSDPEGDPKCFNVPPLSFLILDCRYNRAEGDNSFVSGLQMTRLNDWIEELNRQGWYGFLCLGQPIFHQPANWFERRFADRSLPDYNQYRKLVESLAKSKQPLVILTGDVHFGRIARCRLAGAADLFEVISSPTSLVDPLVGGKAHLPPPTYPAQPLAGIPRVAIHVVNTVEQTPAMTPNENFLTMHFWSKGPSVRVRLKFWPVRTQGQNPTPIQISQFDLVTTS